MTPPPVSCLCLTFARPRLLLEEAVQSFLAQDYAGPKELLVLNDFAAQTFVFRHPEVTVVNLPVRFHSVGEKRNASVALARYDLLAVWDDDDINLPHRLSVSVARYRDSRRFFKPARSFVLNHGVLSGPKKNVFHGSSLFHRSLFDQVGGYPHMGSGEDQELEARFRSVIGGPLADDDLPPEELFYLYRWSGTGSYHLSGFGRDNDLARDYARRALEQGQIESGELSLNPHWSRDYSQLVRDYLLTASGISSIL